MKKFKDAFFGFVVGDALGVPYEFKPRGGFICTDMVGEGSHCMPKGTWSDDTSTVLATMQAIINDKGKIKVRNIRNEIFSWLTEAKYTPYGKVFDVGVTTQRILYNDKMFSDYNEDNNGNGALMRMLPLAFVKHDKMDILDVAHLTHNHFISDKCCLEYIDILDHNGKFSIALASIAGLPIEKIKSSGYVIDTFEAVIWCITNTNNYRDAVLKAVNLGKDTDTIAALVGSIAGLRYGYEDIPVEWINALARKDYLEEMCNKFERVI